MHHENTLYATHFDWVRLPTNIWLDISEPIQVFNVLINTFILITMSIHSSSRQEARIREMINMKIYVFDVLQNSQNWH